MSASRKTRRTKVDGWARVWGPGHWPRVVLKEPSVASRTRVPLAICLSWASPIHPLWGVTMATASVETCQGQSVSMANHVIPCSQPYACHPFAQLISPWCCCLVSGCSVGFGTFFFFLIVYTACISICSLCMCWPWEDGK